MTACASGHSYCTDADRRPRREIQRYSIQRRNTAVNAPTTQGPRADESERKNLVQRMFRKRTHFPPQTSPVASQVQGSPAAPPAPVCTPGRIASRSHPPRCSTERMGRISPPPLPVASGYPVTSDCVEHRRPFSGPFLRSASHLLKRCRLSSRDITARGMFTTHAIEAGC